MSIGMVESRPNFLTVIELHANLEGQPLEIEMSECIYDLPLAQLTTRSRLCVP